MVIEVASLAIPENEYDPARRPPCSGAPAPEIRAAREIVSRMAKVTGLRPVFKESARPRSANPSAIKQRSATRSRSHSVDTEEFISVITRHSRGPISAGRPACRNRPDCVRRRDFCPADGGSHAGATAGRHFSRRKRRARQ